MLITVLTKIEIQAFVCNYILQTKIRVRLNNNDFSALTANLFHLNRIFLLHTRIITNLEQSLLFLQLKKLLKFINV
jgi:hypothetical protein